MTMSEATKSINVQVAPALGSRSALFEYLPALLPLVGAAIMVVVRKRLGPGGFPGGGGLIPVGLFCYITAAAMHATNVWAPSRILEKIGLWTASLGFFFNLSSWL